MEAEELGNLGLGTPEGPLGEALEKYRRLYDTYTPRDARYLTLHRGHVLFLRQDEQHIVTEDLMRMFTMTGTEDEVVGWVRQLGEAGFAQVTFQMTPGQEQDSLGRWARVAEKVGAVQPAAA
jgi:hypothetical protein